MLSELATTPGQWKNRSLVRRSKKAVAGLIDDVV